MSKASDYRDGCEDSTVAGDFLIAEFNELLSSFRHTEELGEKRVEFFITLTTAVLGAVVLLDRITGAVAIAALAMLLIFGLLVRKRIIRRNIKSHEYLRGTDRIRCYFASMHPEWEEYMFTAIRQDEPTRTSQIGGPISCLSFGTGGLLQVVSLVNSLLGGALAALVVLNAAFQASPAPNCTWAIAWPFLSALIVAICLWVGQMELSRRQYVKAEKRIGPEDESPNGD